MAIRELPFPGPKVGLNVLNSLVHKRSLLPALEIMYKEMGEIFRIPLPNFNPVVLVGPEANHFVLVDAKNDLRWRVEQDPVVNLLHHGVLVEDGKFHEFLRRSMLPALHKQSLDRYIDKMIDRTDEVTSEWISGGQYDMLIEMRRIALLILVDTLFGVEISHKINRLWTSVLKSIDFISPGLWILWPEMPRPGYKHAIADINEFLFTIIKERRMNLKDQNDLLSILVSNPDFTDDLIKDQLLTILIAGHDTSTALLAWTLYLVGKYPRYLENIQSEILETFGRHGFDPEKLQKIESLEQIISESLRMYPPIHVGNRIAAKDLEFRGFRIPAGTRVMYSIYLSHRMEKYWPSPSCFEPERFSSLERNLRPPYVFVGFGGGSRNCIGLAYAKLEVKIVLTRLFQKFYFKLQKDDVYPHMGSTLEPRPGVIMQVKRIV